MSVNTVSFRDTSNDWRIDQGPGIYFEETNFEWLKINLEINFEISREHQVVTDEYKGDQIWVFRS